MLKLQPNPTFKAEVLINLPDGNEAKIKVEFRHKSRKDLEAWLKSTTTAPDEDGETDVVRKDGEALAEVIVGWSGVDEKYSVENLEVLLDNYPSAGRSFVNSYLQALLEGKRKN